MNTVGVILLVTVMAVTFSVAISKPDGKDKRVHDKAPLSDKDHYKDDDSHEHNADYDHEAFLGKEDAHDFDDLSPEESKEKLGIIFDKIDVSGDGFVTEEELKNWMKHVQNRYIIQDTDRQWEEQEITDNVLKWENFVKKSYQDEKSEDVEHMKQRDQKRWHAADLSKDGHLSKEEYTHFLHPEEADHMKEVVIDETLEDMDKDKDGFISMEEYVADTHTNDTDAEKIAEDKKEFTEKLDKNKDGKLDRAEIMAWEFPEKDKTDVIVETKHLIAKADENMDEKLTKQEVLDKYDLFVSSQATDFGDALTTHDEF